MQVCFYLLAVVLTVFIGCSNSYAQTGRKLFIEKSVGSEHALEDTRYDFGLGKALDLFSNSTDTNLYDPITIATLKQLQDDARPVMGPDDIDVDKTRRTVEKAFAIQSGRSFSQLMNGSELRSTYRSLLRSIQSIQDVFRYSLQEGDTGLTITREKKGRKLVEFSVEMSVKQGFDPQIRLGERFRFRYDYTESRPMFEYGFRF